MKMTTKALSARAFEAGRAAGRQAGNWLAESVHAIAEILPGELTPAQYRAIRAEWARGYAETFGCKEVSAQNQWAKVWKGVESAYGFKKPQTEEARRKAAQRAAQRATATGDGEPVPPAKGKQAAQKARMELSAIEAHLVSLLRRGQFKACVDVIHKLAEESTTT